MYIWVGDCVMLSRFLSLIVLKPLITAASDMGSNFFSALGASIFQLVFLSSIQWMFFPQSGLGFPIFPWCIKSNFHVSAFFLQSNCSLLHHLSWSHYASYTVQTYVRDLASSVWPDNGVRSWLFNKSKMPTFTLTNLTLDHSTVCLLHSPNNLGN